jgi:Mg2+/Co2+ transporter CorC
MENREQQILSEIKSMMASIRSQLERLDAKMAELQQVVDPEEFDMAPIDIDIDEVAHEEPVQIVEVQEIPMEVEEPEEEVVEESVEEVADFPEEEPVGNIWERFLEKKEHVSVIIDEYGTFRGIVTMEDVIETMLGQEIVDETDEVVDMQEYAKEQWEKAQKDILKAE